jgi:hypothetical protein
MKLSRVLRIHDKLHLVQRLPEGREITHRSGIVGTRITAKPLDRIIHALRKPTTE